MKTRIWYYLLSFAIGMVYLSLYLAAHAYLGSSEIISSINLLYFYFNIVIVITFLVKDAIDERNIRRDSVPIGPSWFEHGPFIIIVAIQTLISIAYDTEDFIIYFKVGLFLVALLDFIWDLSQDERSKAKR
ncbi:MAG: hypothetical protein ACTSRL_14285 [Candidatus Helarchaeota archaeon]